MYDFHEFLGRGIIAARTGRPMDAVKYLSIAEKIRPGNVRVWLWLATAVESFAEKRHCLEHVLELAPNTLAAKVLLERLDQKESTTGQSPADMVVFTCNSCGGKQHFDPDLLALVCDFCKQAEILTLANAFNAEIDLAPTLSQGSGNWALLESQVACSACGAKISIPAERSLQACPFCASEHIIVTPATPSLVPPTAIAPFEIHSEDVRKILRKWWQIPFLTPAHLLNLSNKAITLSPIYLPFWTFDGRVQIRCKLDHNVQPGNYSEKDRVITLHDNLFLETGSRYWNWYECDIDDLLVYAARSVTNKAVAQIMPFKLQALLEYRPAVLAGWQAELYQIALEDAAVQANKHMRDHAFGMAARRSLFMEPNHMLDNDVFIVDTTYKLILLPVWVVRYTFRNQPYQALVNGQTGKVAGERPIDWKPVWLALGLAILAVILLAALGLLLRG
jgi:predicted RNA-binding Zn-ribbon protein involved in translation (DUF1610 family)